jgi:hypothetical protein
MTNIVDLATNLCPDGKLTLNERFNRDVDMLDKQDLADLGW